MSKVYWFSFTSPPSSSANLSPTFINFIKFDGTTLAAPGITQPITGTGLYQFTYTPSFSIGFVIDGATTGLNNLQRYISGNIDTFDSADEIGATCVALGNTNVAIGTTVQSILTGLSIGIYAVLGSTASSYGTSVTDPVDLFGYLKRIREILEGSQSFNKTSGAWSIYSRGFTQLLASKTLVNDASGVTRS